MTPLIDAARTLLELLDEHDLPPWRTLAERCLWVAAVKDLRTCAEDAEADLARAADTEPVAWEVRAYGASGHSVSRSRYETLTEAEAEQRRWEATGPGRRATIEKIP